MANKWFTVTLDKNDPRRMITSDGGVMIASHEKMAKRIADELNLRTVEIARLQQVVKDQFATISELTRPF